MNKKSSLEVATFLSPNLVSLYKEIGQVSAAELRSELSFVVGNDFDEFMHRPFDLAFACGFWYAHHTEEYTPLVAPVMSAPRYQGKPVYFVDLLVRADEEGTRLIDWQHRKFGYNEQHSFSGYHAFAEYLRQSEDTPNIEELFGQQITTGSHLNSIKALVDGDIDLAAIDSTVLDLEWKNQPNLSHALKILVSLGPYPVPPLLINKNLESAYRQLLLATLLALPPTLFEPYQMQGLREVNAATYSALVNLVNK